MGEPRSSGDQIDWYEYDRPGQDESRIVARGDVLSERTLFGHTVTWVVESIDKEGLVLSRGATRRNVEHTVVRTGFMDGRVAVVEPETHAVRHHQHDPDDLDR